MAAIEMSSDVRETDEQVQELVSQRNFNAAINVYSDRIKTFEMSSRDKSNERESKVLAHLYNNRGHIHYLAVEFDDALHNYNKALNLHPDFAAALYNKATVLYRLGDFNLACASARKAVCLAPENEDFKAGLASIVRAMEKHVA